MKKLRHQIKMAYRRWRCDHFDHPFRLVKELPSKLDLLAPIMDEYWCGYCQREFDMPVLHQNCKCQILPIMKDDAPFDKQVKHGVDGMAPLPQYPSLGEDQSESLL